MTPPFPNTPKPAWYRRGQWKADFSNRNGVHYVGDEVIIDLTFPTSSYDTFKRTASFDNGTDGATLSTSERGYYSLFTTISGTPTYSSTHAYGELSVMVNSSSEFLRWDYATAATNEFGRIYLYATAFPTSLITFWAGQSASIHVNTTGKLVLNNVTPTTNSIALNQWVRIEFNANYGTDVLECKLFNSPDSTTPTETQTDGSALPANNQLFRVGTVNAASWGSDFWIDNLVGGASSYPGPWDPDEAPTSPVTYTVRDFYGTIVSTGTFDESQSWFSPDTPLGGWDPGWYRVYLTGPNSDANFFDSYGATNFCVIRNDSHFTPMPVATTVGGYNGEAPDLVMKGVMGLGTSRLIISDAENYAADLANAQLELALTETYWTNTGTPDTARTSREPWCTFPNGGADSPGQLAGVTDVVAALYPGCKYFEGPSNEPAMDATTAAKMQDFADAVHAGHPNAIAIGPSAVGIPPLLDWSGFLDNGGGDACDEISFHAYNTVVNGDMNLGKYVLESFLGTLEAYGLQGKGLWQTESSGGQTDVYRIYHPRRSRKPLMETLLMEQKSIPRERNNWWYDTSHGFWDVPAWIENGDGSLEPYAVLGRVLAEETWGKPFFSALDFGIPGNSIFLGNVYLGDDGITVALMATSFMEDASVQLTLTGAGSSVTVVDGFGNTSSVPVSGGHMEVSLTEIPSYVRLPVNATVAIRAVNDWPVTGIGSSSSPSATTKKIDAVSYPEIADDLYMTNYGSGTGIAPATFAEPGDPVDILWDAAQTVRRLLIWCGPCWQSAGTMIEFTVETTTDGVNWTPQKTVSKTNPPYFEFGTDDSNAGCFLETYWDEQWVFDVLLDEAVLATGVRLNVTSASFGGEPLSDTTYGTAFGQGTDVEAFKIQEVGVFSVGEAQDVHRGGGAPPKGLAKRNVGDGDTTYQSYIILSG